MVDLGENENFEEEKTNNKTSDIQLQIQKLIKNRQSAR